MGCLFCIHPTWVSELKELEDTYFRHTKRPIVPLYLYGAGVKADLKGNYTMSVCYLLCVDIRDKCSLHGTREGDVLVGIKSVRRTPLCPPLVIPFSVDSPAHEYSMNIAYTYHEH